MFVRATLFRIVLLAGLLLPLAAGGLVASSASAAPMMPAKTGDLNGDGVSNSLDALYVLFYAAGVSGKQSAGWVAAADVNCDGIVNAVDASLILQHDAGLYNLRP